MRKKNLVLIVGVPILPFNDSSLFNLVIEVKRRK